MELHTNVLMAMVMSLCSAMPQSQPLSTVYGVPSLNVPQRAPELGMTPQYQALAYQYIANLAGYQNPPQVAIAPARFEDFGIIGEPALPDLGRKEPVTENPLSPLQPSHLLPSDFVLLATNPQSQFFGHFDGVKSKRVTGFEPTALPQIGGVLSNFILQRNIPSKQQTKRETFAYSNDDEVVINAAQKVEEPSTNAPDSSSSKNCSTDTTTAEEEPQPSVAQSKPAAIAVAGPGGVAQAAPVATAVVGKGGLAIAAPSATAVAGKGAAVQGGEEKTRNVNGTATASDLMKKKLITR